MKVLTTLNKLWNLALIGIHYGNLATDILTLRDFWIEGYHVYFWVLIGFAVIAYLISGFFAFGLPFKRPIPLLLWLPMLDYAAWVLVDSRRANAAVKDVKTAPLIDQEKQLEEENLPKPAKHGSILYMRKATMIIVQSVPSIIITLHSIFVGKIIAVMPHVSIFFAILDLAFSNAWIGDLFLEKQEPTILKLDWNFIKGVIKTTFLIALSHLSFCLLWGSMVAVTRPWGAWISIPVFILIAFSSHMIFRRKLVGEALFICLAGFLYVMETVLLPSYLKAKLICCGLMGIAFIIFRDNLTELFNDSILWMIYFYFAISCAVVEIFLMVVLKLDKKVEIAH